MEDILAVIQKRVNKIVKREYQWDDCPPEFVVSLVQRYNREGEISEHEIGLTVVHNGQTYTRTIFPVLSNKYGYPSLEEEMKYLYNNTM